MKIEWHVLARLDLIENVRYVAAENLDAALRLRTAIREQAALLEEMPGMGRPGRVRGTRELVIAGTRYIVAYAVMKDKVAVLRVLHGARDWPVRF